MSARQRLQRRGATLRHRKMTTLANLLELPVMAAPPTHFYSLTPYNTGTQGYVWSPSSRGYTNRSGESSSGQSSPKPETPPRPSSQKSLQLSPQHSMILNQQLNPSKEIETTKNEETAFSSLIPENYAKPISLETPRPMNERQKRTQAESLASALGDNFGTDEIVAEELDLNDISSKARRALTLDECEEINEDCNESTEDCETFYDCTEGLSASHANLINGLDVPKARNGSQPTKSAPSTPTGTRKLAGILNFLHRSPGKAENINEAKSLPAIPLNFTENENTNKTGKKTKESTVTKGPQRPRPTRLSRVKRGSKTRR